jgi:hypothetical protein
VEPPGTAREPGPVDGDVLRCRTLNPQRTLTIDGFLDPHHSARAGQPGDQMLRSLEDEVPAEMRKHYEWASIRHE